jgi:hypothetical protein
MPRTHLINGRAELLLRPDFETTSATMLFLVAIASIATLAGKNRQSGSFALPFIK